MPVTTTSVHLDNIGQIALTVTNLDEARAFYRDTLGMRFLFDAGTLTFFQCGSVRLMLTTGEAKAGDDRTVLYFRVHDLEGTHAALVAASVSFEQEPHLIAGMPDHELWMAFLRDPCGNLLGLMEEKPRAA
ncbi:MAG TPA: VOC family protein [Acidobacteriaceae bacterium]|jgi:methylmalonyl-CoA/ethylmalonyl-CoA epimerase|nr:VOC family protein [Acidobacteriaceae bacterium]